MKKMIYLTITLFLLLSCNREQASKNISESNNVVSIISENNEIQEFEFIYDSRDIFYHLFSDIKNNYYDYNYDRNYTIIKDSPFDRDFILPKESYVVKNDYIEIDYYPNEYVRFAVRNIYTIDGIIPNFVPYEVTIKKHSTKYYLGKYIGKNINDVIEDFDNTYTMIIRDINKTLYIYSSELSNISFVTNNNIVNSIIYGYFYN